MKAELSVRSRQGPGHLRMSTRTYEGHLKEDKQLLKQGKPLVNLHLVSSRQSHGHVVVRYDLD